MTSCDDTTPAVRFAFDFDSRYETVGRAFGVRPETAFVEVGDEDLVARFGPWSVTTPLDNVADVSVSGPYSVPKTIGPAHLSLRDRGITFATNARSGACIRFHQPVRGIDPLGLIRHPGLTVTVDDPGALKAALERLTEITAEPEERRFEQAGRDQLETMTASELRSYAADRGIAHASSLKKAELVTLIEEHAGRRELAEELAER